ncbi:hypothetical protein DSM3645_26409 [Blastopirellula marina DSM 3645]|uniref:Uncharacterized protein n=1 Tax=Blastopirellula marina DSM 3645 TaxID=314230 RepID=A3ZWJ5_9BACT|nr:hypothetical protein DSM3645_26409 [Blastopirellula marina DSM 3645]
MHKKDAHRSDEMKNWSFIAKSVNHFA